MSSVPVSLEPFGCALNHIGRAPGPRRSRTPGFGSGRFDRPGELGFPPLPQSSTDTHPAHQLDTPLSPNHPGESRREKRRPQTSETSPPVQTGPTELRKRRSCPFGRSFGTVGSETTGGRSTGTWSGTHCGRSPVDHAQRLELKIFFFPLVTRVTELWT